jgi:hypothetical protein
MQALPAQPLSGARLAYFPMIWYKNLDWPAFDRPRGPAEGDSAERTQSPGRLWL